MPRWHWQTSTPDLNGLYKSSFSSVILSVQAELFHELTLPLGWYRQGYLPCAILCLVVHYFSLLFRRMPAGRQFGIGRRRGSEACALHHLGVRNSNTSILILPGKRVSQKERVDATVVNAGDAWPFDNSAQSSRG